jgi:hypothetical protein
MGERLIVSFSVSVSFSLLALSSCVQIDHLTILRTLSLFSQAGATAYAVLEMAFCIISQSYYLHPFIINSKNDIN